MRCEEAAEFVSALCDGESIPPVAAEHVGACEACQARLKEYGQIGTELRRVASLEPPTELRPLTWETRQGTASSWSERGWALLVPLLLIAWLYASILAGLFLQWVGPHHDPNFSHGIFVPLFALFVLWQDRKKLKAIVSAPSWTGLPLVVLSLLVLVLGVLGAELFLSRVSLLILLAGLIILFQGWTFFRAVLFPWAFLFLMIPIPALVFNQITFPLQMLASNVAAEILQLLGVSVLREGNVINLPTMALEVAQACSGIRSLVSLLTLAIIYGYLMEKPLWVRWVLALAAVPITVAANDVRIIGTGLLVQYWDPEMAEGYFHASWGLITFVVSLIMLYGLHRLVRFLFPEKARQLFRSSAPASTSVLPDLTPFGTKLFPRLLSYFEKGKHLAEVQVTELKTTEQLPSSVFEPAVGAVAKPGYWSPGGGHYPPSALLGVRGSTASLILATLFIAAAAIFLQARARSEVFPPRLALAQFPIQLGNWTGTNVAIDKEVLDVLGPGDFLLRVYQDQGKNRYLDLFVAYFRSQRAGDTIHSPKNCLPGAGWTQIESRRITISRPGHQPFPATRYVIAKGDARQVVLYWYWAHDRGVASEYWAKFYLVADSIKMTRSDGALVRITTPMFPGETADAAQQQLLSFTAEVIPLLDDYIPR
jgi:EpsI family protein